MIRSVVAILVLAVVALAVAQSKDNCPENEEWALCGTLCEPTCSNPDPIALLCPGIQCSRYTASCRCKKGFFRKKNFTCVLIADC
ncbi:chymotrypsin inhibitor-like [Colletes gigas]|uniref:chymotrypsin inhibitor-like n=1 Tax=Colletes gigas TaxID=935657 RepID=UPI001C9A79FA|nr:chymotrypsin inhibitor-like [Colletes gigas]